MVTTSSEQGQGPDRDQGLYEGRGRHTEEATLSMSAAPPEFDWPRVGEEGGVEACLTQSQFIEWCCDIQKMYWKWAFCPIYPRMSHRPLQTGWADLKVWLLVINPLTQRFITVLRATVHCQ